MKFLERLQLVLAALAVVAPAAHVLELPNKLALEGNLWLAVQKHLYRGWGPLLGGPVEIAALASSIALAVLLRRDRVASATAMVAALAYAGMIVTFFVFNAPVNEAINQATLDQLPENWPALRARWESGHAIAAILAVIALAAALRLWLHQHPRARREPARAS